MTDTPKPDEDSEPERLFISAAWARTFFASDDRENVLQYVRSDLYEAERAARKDAEAERVAEWNRRRDAEASRDVEKAVAETQRAAREAADAHTAAAVAAAADIFAAHPNIEMAKYAGGWRHEVYGAIRALITPTGTAALDRYVAARLAEAQAEMDATDAEWCEKVAAKDAQIEALQKQKDGAYLERNHLVAVLAGVYPSGIKRTAIPGWSDDWHGCVYIDFPWGQASWHYHDSHAYLFTHLPPYAGEWNGHTTDEKYAAIRATLKGNDK